MKPLAILINALVAFKISPSSETEEPLERSKRGCPKGQWEQCLKVCMVVACWEVCNCADSP